MSNAINTQLFARLHKVERRRDHVIVRGIIAEEKPDLVNEMLDFARSMPHFIQWAEATKKRTGGKSVGNVRAMHGNEMVAVGVLKVMAIRFKRRVVEVVAKIVDPDAIEKCLEGVYSGFSISAEILDAWRLPHEEFTRYEGRPFETSLVDSPMMPGATFVIVKADGVSVVRRFRGAIMDENTDVTGTENESTEKAETATDSPKTSTSADGASDGNAATDDGDPGDVTVTATKAEGGQSIGDQIKGLLAQSQSETNGILQKLAAGMQSQGKAMKTAFEALDTGQKELKGVVGGLEERLKKVEDRPADVGRKVSAADKKFGLPTTEKGELDLDAQAHGINALVRKMEASGQYSRDEIRKMVEEATDELIALSEERTVDLRAAGFRLRRQ